MTRLEQLYGTFFEKIEEDADFFEYNNLNDKDAQKLARSRAHTYLKQALALYRAKCHGGFDAFNYDEAAGMFNLVLREDEIDLLSSLMVQFYMKGRLARLKSFDLNFVPKDLKVFSPADERRSFMAMYQQICRENEERMDGYNAMDADGALRNIEYGRYAANLVEEDF